MKIETKFSNGDSVYLATCYEQSVRDPCAACNGSGRMKVEGRSLTLDCVTCYGRGEIVTGSTWVAAARPITIGQVCVEVTESRGTPDAFGDNYKPQNGRSEQYMANETGVGSGSLYDAENLFATEAEALARGALLAFETNERCDEIARRQEAERVRYEARFEQDELETAEGAA